MDFKESSQDNSGLFILKNTFRAKAGTARHLHYDQDEWFYSTEGEFMFEVGRESTSLKPGDSLFAPRKAPYVWAYVGDTNGRILVVFTRAGKMEALFREVTRANAMPPQAPELWRAHGMALLGPPLSVQ